MENSKQPSLTMGLVGHVDHGKTTLTKLISGKWTDTHSEEAKKHVTIKLGYSNFDIYYDEKNQKYDSDKGEGLKHIRKISIVDAPGHENLIATMISGAAVIDCALLLIAADESCPQPQTREHLKTLEIVGIKDIIVVQNKIDAVTKEEALENHKQIKEFLKGTIAENAPIIPVSAGHGANKDVLLQYITERFGERERERSGEPIMYLVRSFDINKPGIPVNDVKGGVLGGAIKRGSLKEKEEIEIKPGIMTQKGGKETWEPIYTTADSISSENENLKEAFPGGSVGIRTQLDPSLTKSDSLVGQMVSKKGKLPEPLTEIHIENKLLEKVVGTEEEHEVKPIVQNEVLMLIINSLKTVGVVKKANPQESVISLRKPVMGFDKDKAVIFRRFEGNKWHIIGYGQINTDKSS